MPVSCQNIMQPAPSLCASKVQARCFSSTVRQSSGCVHCCRSLSVPVWESSFIPHPTQSMVMDGLLTSEQFCKSYKSFRYGSAEARGLCLDTDGQQLVGRSFSGEHTTLSAAALPVVLSANVWCAPSIHPYLQLSSHLHAVNQV